MTSLPTLPARTTELQQLSMALDAPKLRGLSPTDRDRDRPVAASRHGNGHLRCCAPSFPERFSENEEGPWPASICLPLPDAADAGRVRVSCASSFRCARNILGWRHFDGP